MTTEKPDSGKKDNLKTEVMKHRWKYESLRKQLVGANIGFDLRKEIFDAFKRKDEALASSEAKIKHLEKERERALNSIDKWDNAYQELKKKLASSEAENNQLVASLKEIHHNSKIMGELLKEKEAKIKELKDQIFGYEHSKIGDLRSEIAEKDKEIEELTEFCHYLRYTGDNLIEIIEELEDIHHYEELQSNSRDFWKAEAIKLKKELDSRRTA